MAKRKPQRSVVLAEDDPDMRDILSFWLEGEGYRVLPCADGWEAIERIRETLAEGDNLGAVVLDLLMPRVDGYQACRYLRHDPELFAIPIVMFSAVFVDEEEQRFGYDVGADDFVMKTSGFNALLTAIHRVIHDGPTVERKLADAEQARMIREEIEAIVRS